MQQYWVQIGDWYEEEKEIPDRFLFLVPLGPEPGVLAFEAPGPEASQRPAHDLEAGEAGTQLHT